MLDEAAGAEPRGADLERGASGASRAREFQDVLAKLRELDLVRGGLLVTPDGLVVTADLPQRISAEALAALAATLGRELEVSSDDLGRGTFRTAFFSADDGAVFVGGTTLGFVVLLVDRGADPGTITPALRTALSRLDGIWGSSEVGIGRP
jgi:predicted regulator of Ras-like GTPase activity (Roadblock/LC7/MglB family)